MARKKFKKRQEKRYNEPEEQQEEVSENEEEEVEGDDEPINLDKGLIKLGLLAVIACTLVYKGFMQGDAASSDAVADNTNVTQQPTDNTVTALSTNPNDPMKVTTQQENLKEGNNAPTSATPTTIAFTAQEHDFGTIKQHSTNKHVFKFTNTGKNPLIINSAQGSCGCTVPEFPKEPIPPGESSEIKVVYKPGTQQGQQKKSVTVTANTKPDKTYLVIKANVEEAPKPEGQGAAE